MTFSRTIFRISAVLVTQSCLCPSERTLPDSEAHANAAPHSSTALSLAASPASEQEARIDSDRTWLVQMTQSWGRAKLSRPIRTGIRVCLGSLIRTSLCACLKKSAINGETSVLRQVFFVSRLKQ